MQYLKQDEIEEFKYQYGKCRQAKHRGNPLCMVCTESKCVNSFKLLCTYCAKTKEHCYHEVLPLEQALSNIVEKIKRSATQNNVIKTKNLKQILDKSFDDAEKMAENIFSQIVCHILDIKKSIGRQIDQQVDILEEFTSLATTIKKQQQNLKADENFCQKTLNLFKNNLEYLQKSSQSSIQQQVNNLEQEILNKRLLISKHLQTIQQESDKMIKHQVLFPLQLSSYFTSVEHQPVREIHTQQLSIANIQAYLAPQKRENEIILASKSSMILLNYNTGKIIKRLVQGLVCMTEITDTQNFAAICTNQAPQAEHIAIYNVKNLKIVKKIPIPTGAIILLNQGNVNQAQQQFQQQPAPLAQAIQNFNPQIFNNNNNNNNNNNFIGGQGPQVINHHNLQQQFVNNNALFQNFVPQQQQIQQVNAALFNNAFGAQQPLNNNQIALQQQVAAANQQVQATNALNKALEQCKLVYDSKTKLLILYGTSVRGVHFISINQARQKGFVLQNESYAIALTFLDYEQKHIVYTGRGAGIIDAYTIPVNQPNYECVSVFRTKNQPKIEKIWDGMLQLQYSDGKSQGYQIKNQAPSRFGEIHSMKAYTSNLTGKSFLVCVTNAELLVIHPLYQNIIYNIKFIAARIFVKMFSQCVYLKATNMQDQSVYHLFDAEHGQYQQREQLRQASIIGQIPNRKIVFSRANQTSDQNAPFKLVFEFNE